MAHTLKIQPEPVETPPADYLLTLNEKEFQFLQALIGSYHTVNGVPSLSPLSSVKDILVDGFYPNDNTALDIWNAMKDEKMDVEPA